MAEQARDEELAHLRAEVRALHAAQAATVTRLATLERRQGRRRDHPWRACALVAATLAVALVPLGLLAANPFDDLNVGSPHNANIDAIYTAGVTTGCVPNAEYCPNATVTREEMASFLARLGGLGSNPPVINAKTAQTASSASHATSADTATSAANAAQLGGLPPGAYLSASGDMVLAIAPIGFVSDDTDTVFDTDHGGDILIGAKSTGSDLSAFRALDVPTTLAGVALRVKSVEICSLSEGTGTQPFVTRTVLNDLQAGATAVIASSTTDEPEGGCYTLAPASPVALQGALVLRLVLTFANLTETFTVTRLTVTMTP